MNSETIVLNSSSFQIISDCYSRRSCIYSYSLEFHNIIFPTSHGGNSKGTYQVENLTIVLVHSHVSFIDNFFSGRIQISGTCSNYQSDPVDTELNYNHLTDLTGPGSGISTILAVSYGITDFSPG